MTFPSSFITSLRRFASIGALALALLSAGEVRGAEADLDPSFDPGSGLDGTALVSAMDADGRFIVAGGFTNYNGVSRLRIVRVNANGSLDTTFDPGTGAGGGFISAIALQADGKILIGGGFTSYNGVAQTRLARLHANGSLDTSFNPGGSGAAGQVSAIKIQADGKILIGGSFQTYNGVSRNSIARLNADGTLDTSFDPGTGTGTNFHRVVAFAIQSDGRIIIGGNFDTYNGVARTAIARIEANGTLDPSFNPGAGAQQSSGTGNVSVLALRGTQILIGGFFTSYNGVARGAIAQLNNDGSLDTSFDPGTGSDNNTVSAIAPLADGKIIIGSNFSNFNGVPRAGLARLNANGSVDMSFDTSNGAGGGGVFTLAVQPDGHIFIAGAFTSYKGVARNRVARVLSSGGAQPSPTPSPVPIPPHTGALWTAGLDLAANEQGNSPNETAATNATISQWSYGYRNGAASTALTLFAPAQHTNSSRGREGYLNAPNPAMQGWDPDAVVLVNISNAPVIYDYGFGQLQPIFPGQMLLSPSATNSFAVVRWTAPAAGNYRILAKWIDLDRNGGNGASAHVVINGKEVFGRKVPADSVGPERFVGQEWNDGGNAAMPATTFKLNAGDVVDFALGSRGDFAFDSTAFNAAIRLVPTVTLTNPGFNDAISERFLAEGEEFGVAAQVESSTPVQSVEFRLNGKRVRRDGTAPYDFYRRLAAGTYYLTAVATDEASGAVAVSQQVKVVVLKPSDLGAQASESQDGSRKISAATGGGRTYVSKVTGLWSDPFTWEPSGVPGPQDDVRVDGHDVILTDHVTVKSLFQFGRISETTQRSDLSLTVTDRLVMSGDIYDLEVVIPAGGSFTNLAGVANLVNVTLINNGDVTITGNGGVKGQGSSLINSGAFTLLPPAGSNLPIVSTFNKIEIKGGLVTLGPWSQLVAAGAGNLIGQDGGSLIGQDGGSLIGQDGGSLIGQDGASLIGQDGGSLLGPDGNRLIGLDGSTLIGQDGGSLIGQDGGSLIGQDGGSFNRSTAAATMQFAPVVEPRGKEFTGGLGGIFFNGGSVGGILNLIANVTNRGAYFAPGNSPGTMRVFGDYTQESAGTLVLEVGGTGTDPLQFDQLQIGGTANLGGKLIVNAINGFTPQAGDTFAPLTYSAVNGSFSSISSNAQLNFGPDGATMQVSGPNPPPPKALNIATRMRVETGDNVLIAGFIITGSQPKKVLIRGIGPSLPVAGALADPTLDLDSGTFFNDDWRSDQQGEIEGTTIPPSSDLESAIVATLDPGAHTAVLRGKNDGTGVGLVEVYDLESGSPVQLANISTRGQVQTGDNVMIGGFIIGGDYPAKVLLRAIGPSLPLEGALQDPTLELVDGQGNIITNDNWRATQETEILATTVPPTNDDEAAIVATLVPGAYTAIVRGKDDTTGIALVEGYNLQ